MKNIYKGLFQGRFLPQLSFMRSKHKHNITKPRLPHFERHIVEHVCLPYFFVKKKPQYLPNTDTCNGRTGDNKKNMVPRLFEILAKEALDKIINSKTIGFFHLNTLSDDEIFQFRVLLKKNGMKFTYYKRPVIINALTGTDYEPVLQLFKGPTAMATSAKLLVSELLKISKKTRKVYLMAALVEDRLLSYSEIKYYGQYESLDAGRTTLVHTLNLPSQNLLQQINQHPNGLVHCLNQRVEHLKKNSAAS